MKKKIITLLFGLLTLSLGVISAEISSSKKVEVASAYYTPSTHYEVSDTASELDSYYSSISNSDTGTTLLSKLQSLNSTKRKNTVGYGGVGTDLGGAVIYTDYDLNNTAKDSNGQTYGTKVASFYTKTSATSWNREHMWPNSHGGNHVEGDILHTRPTISSENSSRGNSFYVEGKNSSSAGWDPYTAGYDAEVRGECARVILYCVVAYPSFTLSDADSHSTSNSNKDNMMGNMNTLIKWHFDYAPNVYEMNRNNGAEYLQGNRNPFVDHPEYVARIWSGFNSTVSSLCSNNASKYESWVPGNYCDYGSNTPVNNDGVTLSKSSASISVGSTTTLSATASNSGAISWTTSNSSVASISSSSSSSGANITITGVAAGTATITARATINGTQYSKTCTVTVTKVVSSLSKGSTSPVKTTYTAGESFDPTGLTITANYSDSTSSDVTNSVVWTPDPLTAGTTSVTGTFGGKTITISGLTVNEISEPVIISNNSYLSVGDYVVLRTAAGVGVTGWNNSKDATVSETESAWKKYYVASASNSGFTLKDETANNFIASPGSSNQFIYGSAATCSTDSSGHLICNNRYLCKNGTNYRFYTSISSYLPFFIYKVPGSSTKTLTSISINTAPTKTTYTEGEYFDPTGLVITRAYSDNTSDTYTYSGHESDFDFNPDLEAELETSDTSVTIFYGGKYCEQSITVNSSAIPVTLESISVSGQTTEFTVGDAFTFGGTVTAHYSDESTEDVTASASFSGYNMSNVGNQTVTVTYNTETTTYSITVSSSQQEENRYEKVTSTTDLSNGQYLIVYETGNVAFNGGLTTLDTANNTISVSISENVISYNNTTEAAEFTITAVSGGYSLLSASGKYIGRSNNSNGMETGTNALVNTISFDSGNAVIAGSGGAKIKYNSANDQKRFRYYGSGQQAVQLYKEVQTSGGGSQQQEDPVLTGITLDTANVKMNFEVDDTFTYEGLVVTAHYDISTYDEVVTGYTVDEPDMSTAGQKSVVVTYKGKSEVYEITVTESGSTPVSYGDATFDASAQGYTDKQSVSSAQIKGSDIVASFEAGSNTSNSPKFYTSGAAVRCYGGNTITITSSKENMTSIIFTFGTGEGSNAISANSGTYANGVWVGSDYTQSVTFTIGGSSGHRRIAGIAVYYYNATSFASEFLSGTGCDETGNDAPTVNWTSMSTKYTNMLFTEDQNTLKNASANESGTTIEQAVARYNYIVNKYGYTNFMNRSTNGIYNNFNLNGLEFSSTSFIVIISAISSIVLVGLIAYKKRKKQ